MQKIKDFFIILGAGLLFAWGILKFFGGKSEISSETKEKDLEIKSKIKDNESIVVKNEGSIQAIEEKIENLEGDESWHLKRKK